MGWILSLSKKEEMKTNQDKALSVQQPYALLEVMGIKDIENRSWNTSYRGRIYIHACGKKNGNLKYALSDEQRSAITAPASAMLKDNDSWLYSSIIGHVDLVDIVEDHPSIWAIPGNYHWVLANPVMFDTPIVNVRGQLNLWNCTECIPKQSNDVKMIFFDVETTGLDPERHGIHQLAGDIVINDEVVDQFEYKVRPFDGCEIDDSALRISGANVLDFRRNHNKEFQVQYMMNAILRKYNPLFSIVDSTDKFFLAGWRAPEFDIKFLKAFFKRNASIEFDSVFWDSYIDVKSLAAQYFLKQRHEMESFSLAPVAKHLGIPVDESKLHSAAYDAYLCRKVYEIVTANK